MGRGRALPCRVFLRPACTDNLRLFAVQESIIHAGFRGFVRIGRTYQPGAN